MYLSFQCFVLPDTQIPKPSNSQISKFSSLQTSNFPTVQFVIFQTLQFPHFPAFDSSNTSALKLKLCNFIVTRLTMKKYGRNGSEVMGATVETNGSQTFRWLSRSNLVVLIILSEGTPPVEGGSIAADGD